MRQVLSHCTCRCLLKTTSFGGLLSRQALFILFALIAFAGCALDGQTANQLSRTIDPARVQVLASHHPAWANESNNAGLVPPEFLLTHLTLVLSRSAQQEAAFVQLLSDQQNPASPDYHHWLTPGEVGQRFGLSEQDITTLEGWLQSQGLTVNWVSPSRAFIGFSGPAANVGRAFQTEMHTYSVNGVERMSVSSNPKFPQAIAPAIKAIHGLYTVDERPLHSARSMASDSPEMNSANGSHFIAPADFALIYDLPPNVGINQTIGIVGRSRTNIADLNNFRNKTLALFQTPVEIVPTAFGGVDPGPAYTSPPGPGVSIEDQLEATLDVIRAGSVAPDAQLLLVVATSNSGGIEAGAQYLVQSSPVPAHVMNISFGACELAAGPSGVQFWDTLFQQAAAEGISVFVSSGDAGASGCDANFATPPVNPLPNSPNYICSSSYATCLGGTEFSEMGNPSLYWNSTNGSNLSSARSYIPEGGWNEPLNGTTTYAAASAGGVSSIIPTPGWQNAPGVPVARAGRYTPDLSFSASAHDGYFACFAADAGDCVNAADGSYRFEYFAGTSAAAPSMAGIAALLNEQLGAPQGNLNPEIYQMASTVPAAFHDITLATSGVSACDTSIPSMCNNSIPSPTSLTGGQPGYLLTNGYDEVTGLGSLDVGAFISKFMGPKTTPDIQMQAAYNITTAQGLSLSLLVDGHRTVPPSGTVTFTRGTYTSAALPLNNGSLFFTFAAGVFAAGTDTLVAHYTPDAAGARSFNPAKASSSVTVTAVPMITPKVTLRFVGTTIISTEALPFAINVDGGQANQAPSGTVTLTSGGYSSEATTLSSGYVAITIPANSLLAGSDTVTARFVPDSASSNIYASASGSISITVPPSPPGILVSGTAVVLLSGATTGNTSTVTVTSTGGFAGSVALTTALTSSPAGAQNLPVLSFGTTSPVNVANLKPGAATLTVSTTPATTSALAYRGDRGVRWSSTAATVFACIFLLGIPARRRAWKITAGMLFLVLAVSSGLLGCGGGGGGGAGPTGTTTNPGTTKGTYAITVTATSGAITSTGIVNLTVN